MNWTLVVDEEAQKAIRKISKRDAERILIAVREFAINPYAGDYEIHTARKLVHVFDIRRRTSKTY